jgi:ferrous iron transport protein A
MERQIKMCSLRPGERAEVVSVEAEARMLRRFLDLGLAEGTEIECVGRSPAGDPSAYLIRGAVIAIRASDAAGVAVRVREGGKWA